jgi:putative intracellular protease/amidase
MNDERISVYLYIFDTMADWEAAYVIAELNTGRFFSRDTRRFSIKTIGLTNASVVTMGGLRIVPDMTIDECGVENAGLLILPGGETWLEDTHVPILEKAHEFLAANVVVAAICGATAALANAGFLNDRRHTSNDLSYLKAVCPGYTGEAYYVTEPAVTDGALVTASGIAPLEFAYQIFHKLEVFTPQALDAWYQLYTTHNPVHFYTLMQSIGSE